MRNKVVKHDFTDHSGGGGSMDSKFATKQELHDAQKDIKHEIELLSAHIDTKFAESDTKIERARNASIMWYIGTSIAIVAILISIFH